VSPGEDGDGYDDKKCRSDHGDLDKPLAVHAFMSTRSETSLSEPRSDEI